MLACAHTRTNFSSGILMCVCVCVCVCVCQGERETRAREREREREIQTCVCVCERERERERERVSAAWAFTACGIVAYVSPYYSMCPHTYLDLVYLDLVCMGPYI